MVRPMTKKKTAPPTTINTTGLTVREYVKQLPAGHSLTMSQMAKESKVPLSTLSMHLKHPTVELSFKNAKRLEVWSGGKISAARTVAA